MGFRLSCLSTYDSVSCPRHPKTICPLSPFLSVSCSRVGAQVTAPNSTTSLSLLFFLSSFELPDNFFELHFSPHPCARFLCFSLLYPHFLFSSYVSRRNNFGQTNIPLWDLFHLFPWNWSLWNLSPSNLSRSASLHQINPYHLSLLSLSCNLIPSNYFPFLRQPLWHATASRATGATVSWLHAESRVWFWSRGCFKWQEPHFVSLNSSINLNHTYLYPIVSTIFSLPNLALSNLPPSNRSRSIFPVSNFCKHSFIYQILPTIFYHIISVKLVFSSFFCANRISTSSARLCRAWVGDMGLHG